MSRELCRASPDLDGLVAGRAVWAWVGVGACATLQTELNAEGCGAFLAGVMLNAEGCGDRVCTCI